MTANKRTEEKKTNMTGNEKKSFTCFNCRKIGHLARDCRSKKDGTQYKKFGTKQKKDYDAFLMSLNNVEVENSWILDALIMYVSNEASSQIFERWKDN